MESSLEICNGCGKVPRSLDLSLGSFSCSRCGHDKTILVNSDEYERVIFNLERTFHETIIKKKLEAVMSSPAYVVQKPAAKKKSAKTVSKSKKKLSSKKYAHKSASKKSSVKRRKIK